MYIVLYWEGNVTQYWKAASLNFQIRPFKKAHFNRDKDRELLHLTRYLQDIADLEDFTVLDHRKWERYHKPVLMVNFRLIEIQFSHPGLDERM